MKIRPLGLESYQHLISVSLRKAPATHWFKNTRFLNVYTGQIQTSNIALAHGRIAYVGDKEPLISAETEVVELEPDQVLVPGYIEPHAHPFQWYNPYTWGRYLLAQGTTTSINDNMVLFKYLSDEQALDFIERLDEAGDHLWLWWSRFDTQTGLEHEEGRFSPETLRRWLQHRFVVQGGEFTSWPHLLKGNQKLAEAMLITKQEFHKRIEGHMPGSSPETLNAITASGVSADHEALTGDDVIHRLRLGLYASLRFSSIRPDLPLLLKEIKDHPELNTSRLLLTNDGSMPFFVEQSGCNQMIKLVLEAGFTPAEAYRMVSLNPATYYGLDEELGGIAPGRLAHLNVLDSLHDPTPRHVMVEGKWVIKDKSYVTQQSTPSWLPDFFPQLNNRSAIRRDDLLSTSGETGLELMNEVITKPYTFDPEESLEQGELYISLVDKQNRWTLNTRIKGFATNLKALASTYTASSHYILIGSDPAEMVNALQYTLNNGGGIYARFTPEEEVWVSLPLGGGMSIEPMEVLSEKSNAFIKLLHKHGHTYEDPIYTLLFLTATHLPFIRLTDQGVYLIREQKIIATANYL